jgi:Zn ribbon nucleic-acid-binding protein
MRFTNITIAFAKYRICPQCKESSPYDKVYDYRDADKSDERFSFRECRLCGHKDEYKPRMGSKKLAKKKKSDEMEKLMEELLGKKTK